MGGEDGHVLVYDMDADVLNVVSCIKVILDADDVDLYDGNLVGGEDEGCMDHDENQVEENDMDLHGELVGDIQHGDLEAHNVERVV